MSNCTTNHPAPVPTARRQWPRWFAATLGLAAGCLFSAAVWNAEGEKPRDIEYLTAPPAPAHQSADEALAKSEGCMSCHAQTDRKTMHASPAVVLGCTDCHGGDASVHHLDPGRVAGLDRPWPEDFQALMEQAHVLPRYPESWHWPASANPKGSYALLNLEAPEYVRFVNPGDYRVAREACGSCHLDIIQAAERSLMATGAMFWGGAAYNNGILPYKRYILGEHYTRDGEPAALYNPTELDEAMIRRGILARLDPMPSWQTTPPADPFRVFERGGRNIVNLFPETGNPNALGLTQRLEEPGRPDFRQSNRAPGTGSRIAVPVLNIHKTRLNDPMMWFLGTNDNPGDFRSSGCTGCHVVYANDRDPRHSGPYAEHGSLGRTRTVDPTIPPDESGHPLRHEFTRAIPTSQCMVCHMHQPNMFMNTFLGYTMWDYESDAPFMWPEEQRYPTSEEIWEINRHNPEEAAIRGKWSDPEFLKQVSELNPQLNDTQFADYHGHGWNFRAVFKRDREGALLDAEGHIVEDDDPDKFDKAVHLSSIHVDAGMHCVDCHFSSDAHGTGNIHGEVMAAVEITCADCHGTSQSYPSLRTSGPAAPPAGHDLGLLRNPDGQRRFEWTERGLIQRSLVEQDLEWTIPLVKDTVNPAASNYNAKAARAKLMAADPVNQEWGTQVAAADLAHKDEEIQCYACHTSWTTSCGGCHLPIQANWKTEKIRYDGGVSRNYATYNPQVARDQMFQLGRHGDIKNNTIAPVRSASALVLSSTNANREKIYIQQPPISASGYSAQAFAPHYPHTERTVETKTCTDCHLSEDNDNNAIMAQLLLLGTNFVNFIGFNAWVGGDGEFSAIQVTEWDEPQAVIGSYLHRYAYPDWYAAHQQRDRQLQTAFDYRTGEPVGCIQLRGEYLFVAEGRGGMRAYDVAGIANKGISQRIITAPFSPLGHDTRIRSRNATCVALPTNQPVHPDRNTGELMREINREQPMHPIYNYALITDAEEGLILTDVNTLVDGELRNNFFTRALTWDADGRLKGARYLKVAGYYVYVATDRELLVLNLDDPLAPRLVAALPMADVRGLEVQFRYLFVTTPRGLEVVDVTWPEDPRRVEGALVPLDDAQRVYVARTYAYVAAGRQGLAIIDVTRPEQPRLNRLFDADGALGDARDVVVGTTNASLFAYVADGVNGLKVVQLTSPELQPRFYGFSPQPNPALIASYPTRRPALSLSRGLERDRAVDETGGQIAVLGRLGSRPFNLEEMRRFFLLEDGTPWFVSDEDE